MRHAARRTPDAERIWDAGAVGRDVCCGGASDLLALEWKLGFPVTVKIEVHTSLKTFICIGALTHAILTH